MRSGISVTGLCILCFVAGIMFFSTFFFHENEANTETLRIIAVTLVGLAFYLRQNARINTLDATINRLETVIDRRRRSRTAEEIHEAHMLHDLTGQG